MPSFIPNIKIFVLDTNVLLHDFRALHSFENRNVVIPITVLEEIDKFKRGSETINYNARGFIRELDNLETKGKSIFESGIDFGNGSRVFVDTENTENEKIKKIFNEDIPDHRILSVAYNLQEKKHEVVLISKDINVRMKAKSLGIETRDYYTDKVETIDSLHTGINISASESNKEIIAKLEKDKTVSFNDKVVPSKNITVPSKDESKPYPNTYFVYKKNEDDTEGVIARYNSESNSLHYVDKNNISAYGIMPRNDEQAVALDMLLNKDIPLVTIMGKAGAGKTLLALAASLELRRDYRQILLARPIVALSNKDLGYLPGDVKTKLDPYMQPLFDNLLVIKNLYAEGSSESKTIENMLEKEKLLISPLAYIRGRTLSKVYFIVDEAQNLTPHEIKTIITRAGENAKIVFTGDINQIDTPYLDERSNGLTYLIDKMKGERLSATVTLEKGERSELAELAANIL